jgi:hypothetical protein
MSEKQTRTSQAQKEKAPETDPAKFFRMVRKGNGWIIQELTVTQTGKISLKELGDWDLRLVTERKLLSEVVKYAR